MNRRILGIILAVLLAIVGTTAVLIYVNQADARALEGKQAVPVLIAGEAIPAGTTALEARMSLIEENMPASAVPSDALAEIDENIGDLVTAIDLKPGQLLTRTQLISKSRQSEIALPEGKLAVTIPVDSGSLGSISLKPGFQVAVFSTFTVGNDSNGYVPSGEQLAFGEDKNQATRLLLPKVEVINVVADRGRATDDDSSESSGFVQHLVTVAVTQPEAERLLHLMNTGKVSLAQVNDNSEVKRSGGIDTRNIFGKG